MAGMPCRFLDPGRGRAGLEAALGYLAANAGASVGRSSSSACRRAPRARSAEADRPADLDLHTMGERVREIVDDQKVLIR